MNEILVSVVIPTHNDSVDKILESLENQSLQKNLYEVIVIDNKSTKLDVAKSVKKYSRARCLREERKGAYYARNLGIKHAKGSIVAFTDADCIADKNWLYDIVEFFKNDKECAMGGSIIKTAPKNWVERNARHLADSQFKFRYKPYLPDYPYIVAANMAFRKSLLNKLRGFDESYSSGGDGDICWRVKDMGYHVSIIKGATIYHPVRDSVSGYYKQNLSYGKGHPLQFKKWYPKRFKFYIDTKTLSALFLNIIFVILLFPSFIIGIDKKERFLHAFLEIVRAWGLIRGRIIGSIKYKVFYI